MPVSTPTADKSVNETGQAVKYRVAYLSVRGNDESFSEQCEEKRSRARICSALQTFLNPFQNHSTMKRIIIDTNFLLIPAQFKVDIFTEINRIMQEPYELCIVDKTIDELNSIKTKASGRDKRAADLALQLLKAKKIKHLKTEKNLNTDKLIVKLAKSPDCVVATQDVALKRVLKQNKVKLIVLRQKKHLELV